MHRHMAVSVADGRHDLGDRSEMMVDGCGDMVNGGHMVHGRSNVDGRCDVMVDGRNVVDGGGNHFVMVHWHWDFHMAGLTMNDGVESVMVIGGVLDGALVSVRVDQTVGSVNGIALAGFVLLFDVAGVRIVDAVREIVVGRCVGIFHVMVRFNQERCVVDGVHWNCDGVGGCHEGEQDDKL